MDRYSPMFRQGLIFRIWLLSKVHAKRLERDLPALLSRKGRALGGGWFSIDQNTDMAELQIEIKDLAARLGLATFSDDQVLKLTGEAAARGTTN